MAFGTITLLQRALGAVIDFCTTLYMGNQTRQQALTPDETNKQIIKLVTPKVFRFYRATAIKLVHV